MKVNTKGILFKLSLLSISTVLMLAASIAPALPLMTQHYQEQSQSSVELLLTVPNFGIILALFVSPLFVKFLGKKATVLLGLILALASGILPMFVDVFQLVFLSRFLFGFGIGLFNSLAVSLLADFYSGDELATMMGYQTVASSVGAASASFIVSFFITKGWQSSFAVYLLLVPVLLLFTLFVPIKNSKEEKQTFDKTVKEKQSVNSNVIALTGLIFILFALYMVIPVKLPELVMSNNLGSMSAVSIITGVSTLVGIPMGLAFGKLHQFFKHNLLIIGLATIASGLLLISFASNLTLVTIGVILSGIGFGATIPFIYTQVAIVAPKNSINLAYTFILIATNIGVFASPLLINSLGKLFSLDTAQGSMQIATTGFIALAIIIILNTFKQKSSQLTEEKGDI